MLAPQASQLIHRRSNARYQPRPKAVGCIPMLGSPDGPALGLALILSPQKTKEVKAIRQRNRLPETRADTVGLPAVHARQIEGAVIGSQNHKAASGAAPSDLCAEFILDTLRIDKPTLD